MNRLISPTKTAPFVAVAFLSCVASPVLAHPGGAGGGNGNGASGNNAVVAGGFNNTASGDQAAVGGGRGNNATSVGCTVDGGRFNSATGFQSTVGGGHRNTASGGNATVSGGNGNAARGQFATVSGGQNNFVGADASFAVVGGGTNNEAVGSNATVPGGARGKARHSGSFVWSGLATVDTVSTNANSFTVRAPGGVRFITTSATSGLDLRITGGVNGVALRPGGTAWVTLSDRESKTDFQTIKPREILSKLAAMPVTSWKYKHDSSRRYIGPTSQDFMDAFHLGDYDKGINTLDADGVTFAAIQGLVEELNERDKAMAARDQTIEELKAKSAEVDELKAKLHAFEQRLGSLPPAP